MNGSLQRTQYTFWVYIPGKIPFFASQWVIVYSGSMVRTLVRRNLSLTQATGVRAMKFGQKIPYFLCTPKFNKLKKILIRSIFALDNIVSQLQQYYIAVHKHHLLYCVKYLKIYLQTLGKSNPYITKMNTIILQERIHNIEFLRRKNFVINHTKNMRKQNSLTFYLLSDLSLLYPT